MALNLTTLTAFVGRITAADANYPYGSSKSETTSGTGDGTPYIKSRADDIFGFQQAMLTEAGIVPSGTADTALDSQYLESLRIILNARTTTHNIISDADYTLSATQNKYNRFVITDTSVLLTTTRNLIVGTTQKRFLVQNNTAQSLVFKTSAGTGITVITGAKADLYCDGTNIIESAAIVISDASETVKGIVELATNAEVIDGIDTQRAITPSGLASVKLLSLENFFHIQDRKTNGTQAGGASTGFQTRTLNTVLKNTITGSSLLNNQITLPAGTYFIKASAPAYRTVGHQLVIYNTSDSAFSIIGDSAYSGSTAQSQTHAFLCGEITIASEKVFELRHFANTASATNGLGIACSSGQVEIYANIEIWKVG